MGYGGEFINAGQDDSTRMLDKLNIARPEDFDIHRQNADRLENMCKFLLSLPSKSGYIYFPPGRWVIGRPTPLGLLNAAERSGRDLLTRNGFMQISDLLVPAGVTLMFASGAVLVPAGYTDAGGSPHFSPLFQADSRARLGRGLETHGNKVPR